MPGHRGSVAAPMTRQGWKLLWGQSTCWNGLTHRKLWCGCINRAVQSRDTAGSLVTAYLICASCRICRCRARRPAGISQTRGQRRRHWLLDTVYRPRAFGMKQGLTLHKELLHSRKPELLLFLQNVLPGSCGFSKMTMHAEKSFTPGHWV